MQNYVVRLESPVSHSFRCQKAADSLDIDVAKKAVHELTVSADLEAPFSVGLIVGASGSGKTTLAQHVYGKDCFKSYVDSGKPVIEQFPAEMTYDECASALLSMGLTSVPCWIRPVYTLSNGQRARAEAALALHKTDDGVVVLDEWTSVVDRTVAKVMSHCVQKHARRTGRRITLVSCHYDVVEWLQPDWIVDCNKQTYEDRRALRQPRTEKLEFSVREVNKQAWAYFSKYHYLSSNLPGGRCFFYGLFHGEDQIGFQCYSAYLPNFQHIMYSNRVVIHPDYAGLGLGMKFIDATAAMMVQKKYRVRATFSAVPLVKARKGNKNWQLKSVSRKIEAEPTYANKYAFSRTNSAKGGANTFRSKVKTYMFEYVGHMLNEKGPQPKL